MGYHLKRRASIITLFILIVSSITISLVILFNINKTKSVIEINYKLNKTNMIDEVIRTMKEDLQTELYEYASWDQLYYALESKDIAWMKANATDYVYNDKNDKYDILYIQDKNNSYYEYYGPKNRDLLIKSSFFKNGMTEGKRVLPNSYNVDFQFIDNDLYLLGIAPIKYNDKINSNGYFVRGKKVDINIFKKILVPYFNFEFISMEFSENYLENTKITSNYVLDLYYPIRNNNNETLNNLKISLNVTPYIQSVNELFPAIVKFLIFITIIVIFLEVKYIYSFAKKLDNVVSEIDCISNGDYTRKIDMVGSKELNKLILHTHSMGETIDKKIKETKQASLDLIYVLIRSIETKDYYTKGHSERVSKYSEIIGTCMNYEDIEDLKKAAILHDIGKIGLMEQILTKEDKLTEEEYAIVKKHPISGYEILKDIDSLKNIATIIKQHHEKYDGTGYVDGLSGENIHLAARIIAVADTFDAITSNRSYRKAKSGGEAIKIIVENSGTQFDPKVVNALLACKDEILESFEESKFE